MKRFLGCLIILVLAMVMPGAYADTDTVSTREQLVALLIRQAASKPDEIPFGYTSALNNRISDSDWMSDVLTEAGIFSARWSYGGGKCTLRSISYMPDHIRCTTESEVVSALQGATNGSVNILLPKALFNELQENSFAGLYQLEGRAGISSRKMSYYDSNGLILYTEIVYEKNFSSVDSLEELRSLMLTYQSMGITEYSVHCNTALFSQLAANNFALLHQLEGESGFSTRDMSYNTSKGLIMYSGIAYADHFVSVSTLDDLKRQMLLYRMMKHDSYSFHVSDALFRQFLADDFAALHIIEGEVGIKNRNMTYSTDKNQVNYSDIEYAMNHAYVQTLDEVKQWMRNCSHMLDGEFSFSCSQELYEELARNDFESLHAIEKNCGIYLRSMLYFDSKRLVAYSNIEYYPGYYIAQSLRLGRPDAIQGQLLTLYNEAQSILREVRGTCGDSPLALQFALQEAIMSRVEYLDGNDANGAHDTAYGALLNGRCECDGYADAFYLLADMAGLNVRFQQGLDIHDREGHLWNVIEHDGQWYFTDLTWCDSSNGSFHLYSNIGKDIAQECYIWNEKCSVVPLASTTSDKYYFYLMENVSFSTPESAAAYVNSQLRSGRCVEILLSKPAHADVEEYVDRFAEYIDVRCSFIYKHTTGAIAFIFYPKN